MREQLVRYKHLTPFCRFVIRLECADRIHVNEPGQLGAFDDERVQFTDARGRWQWIAYREIAALEFIERPLIGIPLDPGRILARGVPCAQIAVYFT